MAGRIAAGWKSLPMPNKKRAHFQHRLALVEKKTTVGKGSRIWAFAHVIAGAVIGTDCNICDHVFIEGGARVGNRVTIKTGVSLWDGVVAEDDVFIGPNAVFTNDLRPRSRVRPPRFPNTLLREGCSLGGNCTILPGLTIGRWSMVGAGAVVTRDVPDYGLVMGAPSRLRGWVCRCGEKLKSKSGGLWVCPGGHHYEQIAETEMKEMALSAGKAQGRVLAAAMREARPS